VRYNLLFYNEMRAFSVDVTWDAADSSIRAKLLSTFFCSQT